MRGYQEHSRAVYTAVIGDIVQSKALARRDAAQKQFLSAIDEINATLRDEIAAKAIVLRGDDFQLLLRSPESLPEVLWVLSGLQPVQMRFGVGIGELETPYQEFAIGSDGPAWHLARSAVEAAHKLKSCPIVVHGLSPKDDAPGNALLRSYYHLLSQMTAKQREFVSLARTGARQQQIANLLGLSQPTVAVGLQKAEFELQTYVAAAAAAFLRRYRFSAQPETYEYQVVSRPKFQTMAAETRVAYDASPRKAPKETSK